MNALMPWLSVLAIGVGAFFVGTYFQRVERKRHEQRKSQMANIGRSMVGQYSAAQALNPKEAQPGLGRVQDQQTQSRYTN